MLYPETALDIGSIRAVLSVPALQSRPYLMAALAQAEAASICQRPTPGQETLSLRAPRPCDAEAVLDIIEAPWTHSATVNRSSGAHATTHYLLLPQGTDSDKPVIEVAQWRSQLHPTLLVAPRLVELASVEHADLAPRAFAAPHGLDARLAEGPACAWSEILAARAEAGCEDHSPKRERAIAQVVP